MKFFRFVLISFILVLLAVGSVFAYNWHESKVIPGSGGTLEGDLLGVADWAKGKQDLDLLGEYTFVTTPEIDKTLIKELYAYQLSDGSVYGAFSYREEQERQKVHSHYVLCGSGVDYAKALVEIEGQYLGKEIHFSSNGFFAIGDAPALLSSYYSRCLKGNYYRG